jgi:eukaryotic-like serine/threonine-protein kinase
MQFSYLLRQRYRIQRTLSAGAFGETYLAVDENPDYPIARQVVVKHLKPKRNDSASLQIAQRLFKAEAETLAQLGERDRIPTLYAYFEEQQEFYLVQEFIDGQTLATEIYNGELSEAATIEIIRQILTGLSIIHDRVSPIVHRDLKPDNIMRRRDDNKLVLIDFGAVKAVRQVTALAPDSNTVAIGTPGYRPIEQAMGHPKLASDIYAVGAIAIECLTGMHPTLLLNQDTLEFEWQSRCQVSDRFAKIINKMVQSRYTDRYPHAMAALREIDGLILPQTTAPITPPPGQLLPETTLPVALAPTTMPEQREPITPPPAPPLPTTTMPVPLALTTIPQDREPQAIYRSAKITRRKFFNRWLLGGSATIGAIVLSQLTRRYVDMPKISSQLFSATPSPLPHVKTERYTSVKLNAQGQIIDKPQFQNESFAEDLGDGVSMTMVKIPAGTFMMGSPETEADRNLNESPQHQVTVPEFFLGQTLVTQEQWQQIVGNNPSYFKGDSKLPVENISWIDALDFCEQLSHKTGRKYRLPSEAEWEYAARAGTTTPFSYGNTIVPELANYEGNYPYLRAAKGVYRQKTTLVRSFAPNPFGLYDMHGNLWEWCLDEYANNYRDAPTDGSASGDIISRAENKQRVMRGGSWGTYAHYCRSSHRDPYTASFRCHYIGVRVVCMLSQTT